MTQDIAGCPYPQCDAGRMLQEIKDANRDYRGDIKTELTDIKKGINALVKASGEDNTRAAVLEQAIIFLREGEKENKAAHIVLFQKIEALERRTTTWLWEMLKLLIVAGLAFAAGMLT